MYLNWLSDILDISGQQHSPETIKPEYNNYWRSNTVQTVTLKTTSQANECILLELVLNSLPQTPQSLKESPLLLFDCLGLISEGSFMTMQPQKCCGVNQEEGIRQDSSD